MARKTAELLRGWVFIGNKYFKVPRHDNKYVHRKNCFIFPQPCVSKSLEFIELRKNVGSLATEEDCGKKIICRTRQKIPATDV